MSIENLIRQQGHVTPKWLIRSSRNSNSSEILWLSWLPASLTKIWSKMNELAWRHHFPIISLWEIFRRSRAANSINSGAIWPKDKLCQHFMHVLVTCKRIGSKTTEKRWRHHNMSIENLICPQGHLTPKWLIRSSWNSNSSEIYGCPGYQQVWRRSDQNELASLETPFSHCKTMGNF